LTKWITHPYEKNYIILELKVMHKIFSSYLSICQLFVTVYICKSDKRTRNMWGTPGKCFRT